MPPWGGKLLIHSELRGIISNIEENTLSICSFTANDNTDKLRIASTLASAQDDNYTTKIVVYYRKLTKIIYSFTTKVAEHYR